MSKTLSTTVTALFLLSALAVCVPGSFDTYGAGEQGLKAEGNWSDYASHFLTEDSDGYKITNAGDLALLSRMVNDGDDFEDMTVILTKDLDLSDHYFTPIGSGDDYSFNGTFDAKGHVINGLMVKNNLESHQGLFGEVGGYGTVMNLGLTDAYVVGDSCVGAIVGLNRGTVKNCHSTDGTVLGLSEWVGGIVGMDNGYGLTDCRNVGGTVSGFSYVGGIVGRYNGTGVSGCYNTSDVTGPDTSIGGIIGLTETSVSGCYNAGTVRGLTNVGGIVGNVSSGNVTNCYNTGDVTGTDTTMLSGYAGGIVGFNGFTTHETVALSYNTGNIRGPLSLAHPICYATDSFTNSYWSNSNWAGTGLLSIDAMSGTVNPVTEMTGFDFTGTWSVSDDLETDFEYFKLTPQLRTFSSHADDSVKEDSTKSVSYGITSSTPWNDNPYVPTGLERDSSNRYIIKDALDLAFLSKNLNNGDPHAPGKKYLDASYIVTSDIVLSKYMFTPIGSDTVKFAGTFDGDGHTVKGLAVNVTTDYAGLFGYLENGTVKDILLSDADVRGDNYVGGIVGYKDISSVSGCYNTGSVSGTGNYVGGLVGYNDAGSVSGCYNTGSVGGTGNFVGGIVGYNDAGTVSECYNAGSVSGSDSVGGIAGSSDGNVTLCYNAGAVRGADSVGGIAGSNDGSITECYNTGIVIGSGASGDISGTNDVGATVSKCYWLIPDTGTELDGALFMRNMTGVTAGTDMQFTDLTTKWTLSADDTTGRSYMVHFPQLKVFAENDDRIVKNASETSTKRSVPRPDGSAWATALNVVPIIPVGDTYEVYNERQLISFALLVNSGTDISGKTVRLMGCLDLSWFIFTPIGTQDNVFQGTFEGNGHGIYGLMTDSTKPLQGLFGRIGTSGTVKDLGLVGSYVFGTTDVGGIVGNNGGTVTDCHVNGKIKGTVGVGGIVGNNGGTIKNSYNNAGVTGMGTSATASTDADVGGIVGVNTGTVSECYNTGSIIGFQDAGAFSYHFNIGGIVGVNTGSGSVTDCYNTGAIRGSAGIGGITGNNDGGTADNLKNCYNTGKITSDGTSGPIAPNGRFKTDTCYWRSDSDTSMGGRTMEHMVGPNSLVSMPGLGDSWTAMRSESINETERFAFTPQLKVFSEDDTKSGTSMLSTGHRMDKAKPDKPDIATYEYILGKKVSDEPVPTVMPTGVTGGYAWVSGTDIITNNSMSSVKVTFTPAGESTDDYIATEFDIDITVTMPALKATYTYVYGDRLGKMDPRTLEDSISTVPGHYEWVTDDVLGKLSVTSAKMRYVPDDTTVPASTFDASITVTTITQTGEYEYMVGDRLFKLDPDDLEAVISNIPGAYAWAETDRTLDETGPTVAQVKYVPEGAGFDTVQFLVDVTVTPAPAPDPQDNTILIVAGIAIAILAAAGVAFYVLRMRH